MFCPSRDRTAGIPPVPCRDPSLDSISVSRPYDFILSSIFPFSQLKLPSTNLPREKYHLSRFVSSSVLSHESFHMACPSLWSFSSTNHFDSKRLSLRFLTDPNLCHVPLFREKSRRALVTLPPFPFLGSLSFFTVPSLFTGLPNIKLYLQDRRDGFN